MGSCATLGLLDIHTMEGMTIAPPSATPPRERDVAENRLTAALSWLWVLSVVILLVKPESAFVQHHARQGFLLFLVSLAAWFVLNLLTPFLTILAWMLQTLLQLAVFVAIVVGFIQALRGVWWVLPVLGPLASKLRFVR